MKPSVFHNAVASMVQAYAEVLREAEQELAIVQAAHRGVQAQLEAARARIKQLENQLETKDAPGDLFAAAPGGQP